MKKIKLTQNKYTLVDDEDYEYLNQYKWCVEKSGDNYYALRQISINKKKKCLFMHRLLNKTPNNFQTDHINGNGLDNRKSNLRTCTASQNQMNKKSQIKSFSKFKGIYYDKDNKKWRVRITINKKLKHLGYFVSQIEAAKSYDVAARKHFGEFARLNFPDLKS